WISTSVAAQTFPGGRVRMPELAAPPPTGASVAVLDDSLPPNADMGQVVQKPAGPAPTPRHTGFKAMAKDLVQDFRPLPSREHLFWTRGGGGLALALQSADG